MHSVSILVHGGGADRSTIGRFIYTLGTGKAILSIESNRVALDRHDTKTERRLGTKREEKMKYIYVNVYLKFRIRAKGIRASE